MIESPILYTGSKRRLVNLGLIDLFPKNIDMFIDLFVGGGSVSLNVNANSYYLNDVNSNVVSMLQYFYQNSPLEIISQINNLISLYDLENDILDDKRHPTEYHKNKYNELRDLFNQDKSRIDVLYCLLIYSFSHQIRFNSSNEFNMPCGNGNFNTQLQEKILNSEKFFHSGKEIFFSNNDFKKLKAENLSANDFVYLDPPYFSTTATYNENGGWTEKDENDLYELCERLNANGIKFGMSNVFKNKGFINQKLIEWCNKNKWNVHTFDNFTYTACGKGNGKTKEVFIYNY